MLAQAYWRKHTILDDATLLTADPLLPHHHAICAAAHLLPL